MRSIYLTFLLALLAFPLQGFAACTGPAGVQTQVIYNKDNHFFQYCDGTGWVAFPLNTTTAADACGASPSPGAVCGDGTVYAGLSPDGNVALYTTPVDGGAKSWVNNNGSGYTLVGSAGSVNSGSTNTAALILADADSDMAGFQPHQAATYCHALTTGGHSDWYLPAPNEMLAIYTARATIPGYNTGYSYWTSREENQYNASLMAGNNGSMNNYATKYDSNHVWCVRKGSYTSTTPSCTNAQEGTLQYNADHRVYQYCDGALWQAAGPVGPTGPKAGCVSPPGTAGQMVFNIDYKRLTYCDGDHWQAVGADPCNRPGMQPGDRCDDGTVYAGISPDGSKKMFVTPTDGGTKSWVNNNGTGYTVVGGAGSVNSGSTNTDALIVADSDSNTVGVQPHLAAIYCKNLTNGGYSDWYLPAPNEMLLIYNARASIPGFNSSFAYWTSREENQYNATLMTGSNGSMNNYATKYDSNHVWCARKQ